MKKLLVQAPRSRELILLAFPFFMKLKELNNDAKIYTVVDSGLEETLELLPFKIEIYPLPKRLNSVAGIHKFAVNVKDIFNIDEFYDLALDHKGALTGFSFRAKKRFGVDQGIKKLMYTDKLKPFSDSISFDERYIQLLNLSLDKPVSDFFYSSPEIVKEESNVIKLFDEGSNDFFLLRNTGLSFDFWKKIIKMMDRGRVVIWDMENVDKWQMLKSDGELKVELIIQGEVTGLSFLRELVVKSSFVLTDDKLFAQSCYFFEKRPFLFSNESIEFSQSKYFSNIENIIQVEGDDPVSIMTYGEEKDVVVASEVVDYICETMNI
jgi:hypothetical protein